MDPGADELMNQSIRLTGEEAMLAFATQAAPVFRNGGVIFLEGTLGAGKTTLSRGLIQALGHPGAVRSPTYTLVEEYRLPDITVCHFDLYRLGDLEELEYIGIRDYFGDDRLSLIEWPQRGTGMLPTADLLITIDDDVQSRILSWTGQTERGREWCRQLDVLSTEQSV